MGFPSCLFFCRSSITRLDIVRWSCAFFQPGPAAPDATNCTDFYLTVYGSSTQSERTVCGQTIEQGKTIPATGHHFENGVCTVCGEKDPNYVPPTGDNANLTLWVVLAAVCAVILVAVVVLLNKKRTRH